MCVPVQEISLSRLLMTCLQKGCADRAENIYTIMVQYGCWDFVELMPRDQTDMIMSGSHRISLTNQKLAG